MTRVKQHNVERLLANVKWAIAHDLGPRDLVPMLDNLARRAQPGSDIELFARHELSALLAGTQPWRAARLCLDVLESAPDDADAWSVLGLAHSMLGNYRCARLAYLRARSLAPDCAATAHNLGHLLDLAFDNPRGALPHLLSAYRLAPDEVEIAGSYAHALVRVGRLRDARRVLSQALPAEPARAEGLLADWQARASAVGRKTASAAGQQAGTSSRQQQQAGSASPRRSARRQGSEG